MSSTPLIETINVNLWSKCNLRCAYCYGDFPERPRQASREEWLAILEAVAPYTRRITFCGGEPTLNPHVGELLDKVQSLGLQTSIITNGAKLTERLVEKLDLVGMTLDATDEPTLRALGRSTPTWPDYYAGLRRCVAMIHRVGRPILKLNTVVSRLNLHVDLVAALRELEPSKWKPLQFTVVVGENEHRAEALSITRAEFDAFVARHREQLPASIWVAPEEDDTVRSTYVMVDPSGRLFSTATGGKLFSAPILDVGLERAFAQVGGYDRERFVARGGHVDVVQRRRLSVLPGGAASPE